MDLDTGDVSMRPTKENGCKGIKTRSTQRGDSCSSLGVNYCRDSCTRGLGLNRGTRFIAEERERERESVDLSIVGLKDFEGLRSFSIRNARLKYLDYAWGVVYRRESIDIPKWIIKNIL